MGAYSNPEILVDTQSGQHWRNLQKDISNTFNKVTEDLVEIAKKNQEYSKQAKLNTKIARDLTSKLDIDNPNMNIQSGVKPLVDEYERLQNDIAFGKSKNITEDRYKIQQIEQAIKKTQGLIENNLAFAKDFREKAANMGMVDGYSQYNDPIAMNIGGVLSNNAKGKMELVYDPQTYEPSFVYYSKTTNDDNTDFGYVEIGKVDSKKMEAYASGQGGLKTIPPATSLFENLRKNPTIFGSKGEILEDFVTKNERIHKQVSKETITNNKLDKDIDVVYKKTYLSPNSEVIKSNLSQNIDAIIDGMISVGDAAVFYNQYVNPNEPIGLNDELTEKQKAATKNWIGDAFIKTLPEIEDKNSPETIEYVTKQTKTPSSNTNKGDGGDKKNQEKAKELADAKKLVYSITPESGPQKIKANGRTVNWNPETGYTASGVALPFETKEEVIGYLEGKATKPVLTVKKK